MSANQNKAVDTLGIKNRIEFIGLIEVIGGNPNGDPDMGGAPRVDPETGLGEISDLSIKRAVRDYVANAKDEVTGNRIYVSNGVPMSRHREEAYKECGLKPSSEVKAPKNLDDLEKIMRFMQDNFFDVRAFGAVMTVKNNCGSYTGPVQIKTLNTSIDPIVVRDMAITCCTEVNENDSSSKMGRKYAIPYALYRIEGTINPNVAEKTGFSEEDLELLWEALLNMYDTNQSASKGRMAMRKLIVFEHESKLGNAPAYELFDAVDVQRKEGVDVARKFSDYAVNIDHEAINPKVSVVIKR